MIKYLFLFIFVINLNAFDLISWNLKNISLENIKEKDIRFIKNKTNSIYDVMCLQGVLNKDTIEYIVDGKNVYYSNNLNNKEYLAWIIKPIFKNNEIVEYEDKNNVFEIKPEMLVMKDINIGIINFNSNLDNSNKESKKNEIKELNSVFNYFQEKTKIDLDRIFLCGSFNLTYGQLKIYLGDFFNIANNEGTTISDKFGYTNDDFDHFISLRNDKATPDYQYFNSFGTDYIKFKKEVSEHIPISINF